VYNEPYIEKKAHLFDTAQCHCACAADGWKFYRQLTLKTGVCSKACKIRNSLKIKSPVLGAHFFHYLLQMWQRLAHYCKYL